MGAATTTNPYPGPRPFNEEDEGEGRKLYGRDREITSLFYRLTAERIVVLHSPSGAGKTSMLNAGLLPRLRAEGFEVERVETASHANLADDLAGRLPDSDPPPGSRAGRVVLVFDQFEEILTLGLDAEARRRFFRQLGEVLENPRVWALFAIRESYLGALDPYRDDVPTRLGNTFRIDLLTREAALEAITRPAADRGRTFGAGVAEKLASDLAELSAGQSGGSREHMSARHVEALPLQVVCARLWDNLLPDVQEIGTTELEAFGSVDDALAAYYDDCVRAEEFLTERRQREWFDERLVTPGGIRDQVLHEPEQSGGLENGLIDQLANRGLVRTEQRARATWYELAHERLVEPVRKSNGAWFVAQLEPWQQQAKLWEKDREDSLLLRGDALTRAKDWDRKRRADMSPAETQLLAVSNRKLWATRIAWLTAALVALVVAVAGGWSYYQWQKAEDALKAESRALAAEAVATSDEDSLTKLELATQAWGAKHTNEARGALRAAVAAALAHPPPNNEPVFFAAFSPDGKLVVTANNYGTARIWDLASRRSLHVLSQEDSISRAVFSPDGSRLLTASYDGTAEIWDVERGESLHVLDACSVKPGCRVKRAAFSPDGARVVTAASDGTAQIWDVESGRSLHTLEGGNGAAFSPDSTRVVTAGTDGTARIYDVASGNLQHELEAGKPVSGAVFSPDGKLVVTAAGPDTAQIWDVASGKRRHVLAGHTAAVSSLAFSPDGTLVVTASDDGTARIWSVNGGPSLQILAVPGQAGVPVYRPVFSPDGRLVVSASDGNTVAIWDVATGRALPLAGHTGPVNSAEFSPDGKLVVTGGADGTTRIWDVATGRSLEPLVVRVLRPVSRMITQGTLVVTASDDGTARIWIVPKPKKGDDSTPEADPLKTLTGHSEPVTGMAFSRRGTRVVTTSADGTARVWDVGDGTTLQTLAADTGTLAWAAFVNRVDGDTVDDLDAQVVTAGTDGTARIWDVANGKTVPPTFKGRNGATGGAVGAVYFSEDGKSYLTVGPDGTAEIRNCTVESSNVCDLPVEQLLSAARARLASNR